MHEQSVGWGFLSLADPHSHPVLLLRQRMRELGRQLRQLLRLRKQLRRLELRLRQFLRWKLREQLQLRRQR